MRGLRRTGLRRGTQTTNTPVDHTFGTVGYGWDATATAFPGGIPFNTSADISLTDNTTDYFNAGLKWNETAVFKITDGSGTPAFDGVANGITPTTATMSLDLTANTLGGDITVVAKGLLGSITVPDGIPNTLADLTTAQSSAVTITAGSTAGVSFSLESVIAEMASDGSWTDARDIYIFLEVTGATATPTAFATWAVSFDNAVLSYL